MGCGTTANRLTGGDFEHYAGGAMKRRFAWGYEYDWAGLLTRVTLQDISGNPVEQARFEYDGTGGRMKKVAGGATTYFVYDASGLLLAEYEGGSTSSGTAYLTQDHLGSTRLVTSAVWFLHYNSERPHSSLAYRTPAEFAARWSAPPAGAPAGT